MRSCRRNLRIRAGGRQSQNGVIGIVERMDDEVRGARMFRIPLEDVFRNGGSLHRVPHGLLARTSRAEQRQRVQHRNFVVGGILLVQPFHRRGVGDVALVFVAGAKQDIDRFDEAPFPAGGRFRRARRCRRRETFEHAARGCDILLRPERVIETHRFAPVREREARIGLLRVAEGFGSRIEFEIVQGLHADKECRLRGAFRRRWKIDRAELAGSVRLRPGRRRAGDEQSNQSDA